MLEMILAGLSAGVLSGDLAYLTSRFLWAEPYSEISKGNPILIAFEASVVAATGVLVGMLVFGHFFSGFLSSPAVDAGLIVSMVTSPVVGCILFYRWKSTALKSAASKDEASKDDAQK